jgi:hypothetical protein
VVLLAIDRCRRHHVSTRPSAVRRDHPRSLSTLRARRIRRELAEMRSTATGARRREDRVRIVAWRIDAGGDMWSPTCSSTQLGWRSSTTTSTVARTCWSVPSPTTRRPTPSRCWPSWRSAVATRDVSTSCWRRSTRPGRRPSACAGGAPAGHQLFFHTMRYEMRRTNCSPPRSHGRPIPRRASASKDTWPCCSRTGDRSRLRSSAPRRSCPTRRGDAVGAAPCARTLVRPRGPSARRARPRPGGPAAARRARQRHLAPGAVDADVRGGGRADAPRCGSTTPVPPPSGSSSSTPRWWRRGSTTRSGGSS